MLENTREVNEWDMYVLICDRETPVRASSGFATMHSYTDALDCCYWNVIEHIDKHYNWQIIIKLQSRRCHQESCTKTIDGNESINLPGSFGSTADGPISYWRQWISCPSFVLLILSILPLEKMNRMLEAVNKKISRKVKWEWGHKFSR